MFEYFQEGAPRLRAWLVFVKPKMFWFVWQLPFFFFGIFLNTIMVFSWLSGLPKLRQSQGGTRENIGKKIKQWHAAGMLEVSCRSNVFAIQEGSSGDLEFFSPSLARTSPHTQNKSHVHHDCLPWFSLRRSHSCNTSKVFRRYRSRKRARSLVNTRTHAIIHKTQQADFATRWNTST